MVILILMTTNNKFEDILIQWAAEKTNTVETAKQLAHEVERAYYHKEPIVSKDSRYMEYLAALFREFARMGKNSE